MVCSYLRIYVVIIIYVCSYFNIRVFLNLLINPAAVNCVVHIYIIEI